MRLPVPATILLVGLLGVAATARGQSWRSGTSQQGMFGNRSMGGFLSAGQRTFGRNPLSGMRGQNNQGNTGQLNYSERFVRGNRQPGSFVGADTQDLGRFLGAVQAGQTGGQNRFSGLGPTGRSAQARQPRNAGGRASGSRRSAAQVRNSLSIAFDYPATAAPRISTALAGRLERSKRIQNLSSIEVELRRGTATLRGVVATDHDRVLAEILALLEAGIWRVKNDLVVAQLPADPALSQPVAPRPEEPDSAPE